MMLPGFDEKHYFALVHLRGNQDFQVLLEGLQQALNKRYASLAESDEDDTIKRTQGRIREIKDFFDTYNKASETVEKLRK